MSAPAPRALHGCYLRYLRDWVRWNLCRRAAGAGTAASIECRRRIRRGDRRAERPRAPLLVLGAYREAEADENWALGRALAELNRLRLLEVLRVRPLEPSETARLAAELLRGDVGPQVTDLLHRHCNFDRFV